MRVCVCDGAGALWSAWFLLGKTVVVERLDASALKWRLSCRRYSDRGRMLSLWVGLLPLRARARSAGRCAWCCDVGV